MANLILWSCVNTLHAPIRTVASYQLASWLRFHGYTVKVIDFCHLMTTNDLVAVTEKYIGSDTLAIGVSSSFWNHWLPANQSHPEPPWVQNARTILETRHKLPWLLGGNSVNSSALVFDWVKFQGNAEDSLLKWMDENSSKLIRRNPFDIKTLEKSFLADDFVRPFEVMPIELGRGCQFKCRFCSYPMIGKKPGTYLRDFTLLKEEFIKNYEEWGTTKYYFQDDTVNESEEKVRALADIAQALPFKLEWTGYNRLDLIWSRPATIQMLKDSGLRSAYFGIESFHPAASMAVGKGWNGKHAKEFLLKLKEDWKGSINWYLSFIIGLPGEDRASIEDSYKWCLDNKMYEWSFHPLSINRSPGKLWKSEFELDYEKYGYSFPDDNQIYNWKSDLWSRDEALALSHELTKRNTNYSMPTAWLLAEIVSLGYTYDEIMNTRKVDLDWGAYRVRTDDMVRKYVRHQLK
jgi:hypothetical protein